MMNARREVLNGLLAAFFSVIIIAGGLTLARAEQRSDQASIQAQPTLALPTPANTSPPDAVYTRQPDPVASQTPIPSASFTPPAEAAQCNYPVGWSPYIVQVGETLESLATRFGVSTERLAQGNCLLGKTLLSGSLLYVPGLPPSPSQSATVQPVHCGPPPGWITYIVQPGDTLFSLGRAFGVSVWQLMNANCLNTSLILTGQRLYVPNVPTRTPATTPTPSLTPSATASHTPTPAITASQTSPPPSSTTTPTATSSPTDSSPASPTPSATPSATAQPTFTPSASPSATASPTATPEPSNTPPPSLTPTFTPPPTSEGN